MKYLKSIGVFSLIIFVFLAAFSRLPASEEAAQVSGQSDVTTLNVSTRLNELVAFGNRGVGSAGHKKSREYLANHLTGLGYAVEVQDSFECALNTCAPVHNILTRKAGTNPGNALMVSAHYDSVESSPGASDNGVGVAIILELARVMANTSTKNDVIFLLSDAEEVGALGAKAFAKEHKWFKDVKVVLNAESLGNYGYASIFETGKHNSDLIATFSKLTEKKQAISVVNDIYTLLPNYTDMSIYRDHGVTGINFGVIANSDKYHTQGDRLESVNMASVGHFSRAYIKLALALAGTDIGNLTDSDVAYSDLFGLTVIAMPFWLLTALAVLAAIVFGFAVHRDSFPGSRLGSVLKSVFAFPLALIVSLGICVLGRLLLEPLLTGELTTTARQIYFSLFFLASFSLTHMLVNRYVDKHVLKYTTTFWWLVLGLATAVFVPKSSFVFVLPAFLMSCALLAASGNKKNSYIVYALAVAAIVVSLHFFTKVAAILDQAYGMQMVLAFCLLISLAASLSLPWFQSAENRKLHWSIVGVFVLGAVGTALLGQNKKQRPDVVNFLVIDDQNKKRNVVVVEDYGVEPHQVSGNAAAYQHHAIYPWQDVPQTYKNLPPLNLPEPSFSQLACRSGNGQYQLKALYKPSHEHALMRLYFPMRNLPETVFVNDKALDYKPFMKPNTPLGYRPVIFGLAGAEANVTVEGKSNVNEIELYVIEEKLFADQQLDGPFVRDPKVQLASFYGDRKAAIARFTLDLSNCRLTRSNVGGSK
jgi:hypothetical protein